MSDMQAIPGMVDQVRPTLHQGGKGKISPVASAVREKVNVLGAQLRDRTRDHARTVDHYVHENPWPVIGLGLVTGGLAVWYLTHRAGLAPNFRKES